MKKLVLLVALLAAIPAMAQDVSKMDTSGQSGPSEKARYVLGLVRNGYADRLNAYFDKEPWQIQTEIDTYTNTDKKASIGIFCVAVDLGNLDVVKSFVENGIGPADLCRVQTFSTKRIVVSRAEALINNTTTSTTTTTDSSSSKQGPGRSVGLTWFGAAYSSNEGSSYKEGTSSTDTTVTHRNEKYTYIHYGEKKVVKTYFANPLDFATGEVFDYLWKKGFRSPNLFTRQALADAKANGRTEVVQYILDNQQEMLKYKPTYISEATYQQLLETGKHDLNSLAYVLLEKDVLGKINSSAQAKALQQQVERELQARLAAGDDTTGYSRVMQEVKLREDKAIATERERRVQADRRVQAEKRAQERERRALEKIKADEIYRWDNHYYARTWDFKWKRNEYAEYDLDGRWVGRFDDSKWEYYREHGRLIKG